MAICTFISNDVILWIDHTSTKPERYVDMPESSARHLELTKRNPRLNQADTPECNDRYTVKLFDLASGEWKKYEVDDRLSTLRLDGGSKPRFGKGSADFEVRME